jgi:type II secretory ATPase GspE/PulE/Tfp pilus assembly ATPase PilB-like protein
LHDDPFVRFIAMCALLAHCEHARELRFELGIDGYRVILDIGGQEFELMPAPREIQHGTVQTVAALAGLDTLKPNEAQRGRVEIIVQECVVPTSVSITPTDSGQSIVIRPIEASATL